MKLTTAEIQALIYLIKILQAARRRSYVQAVSFLIKFFHLDIIGYPITMIETLHFQPAINHPNLVASSITVLLQNWSSVVPVEDIWVAEIDPTAAGGQDFCEKYDVPFDVGANCVIVEATRNKKCIIAACVALVGHQMDFNGIIRKTLNARRISLAPLDLVLQETNMEYGSITPFGLPSHWPILLDARIPNTSRIIIGSGLVKSKLSLPSKALCELSNAIIIEGLATRKKI